MPRRRTSSRHIDERRKYCIRTRLRWMVTSTAAPLLTCAKHTSVCCTSREHLLKQVMMIFMVLRCERDSRQRGVGVSGEGHTLTPRMPQGLTRDRAEARQVHSRKGKNILAPVRKQAQMIPSLKKFCPDKSKPRYCHVQGRVFTDKHAGHFQR